MLLTCYFTLILVMRWLFFFNVTASPEIYTLSLHDALPIWALYVHTEGEGIWPFTGLQETRWAAALRSEEHTSELQSLRHLVCRLLLEKTNWNHTQYSPCCLDSHARPKPLESQAVPADTP